jgi:hypothetical protein
MRAAPMFSYYGSKWRTIPDYPPPIEDTIVESFAGSALYALSWFNRKVWLNDLDPVICGIWDYLIKTTQAEILSLPTDRESMSRLTDLSIPQEAKDLIGFWIRQAGTRPARRVTGWAVTDKDEGAKYWGSAARERVARQVDLIRHWKVTNLPHTELENVRGTHFIDPPYCGKPGAAYKFNNRGINYADLAGWSRSRHGQVIVCEQAPADWLPFRKLRDIRTAGNKISAELIWTNDSDGMPKLLAVAFFDGRFVTMFFGARKEAA